jgi:hypothetical protein
MRMKDDLDDLDRILLTEEPLAPSSGFAAAVMDSVREAAAEPPPLPFPWTRFAVGVIACAVSAAAGTSLIVSANWSEWTDWSALPGAREIAESLGNVAPEVGYAAAAFVGSLALVFAQRFQRRPPTSSR